MTSLARFGLAAALAVALPGPMLRAQDKTEEELRVIFARQLETFQMIRSVDSPRGLVLNRPGPAGGPNPSTDTAVSVAPEEVTLPPEDQVNVRVRFDFDSAAINADQKPTLRTFCRVIDAMDIRLFRIIGHTDAAGPAAYNRRLSLLRAEEVKRFFTDDCGIAPDRLEAIGAGERFLADPKDPMAGENRRVEFQALS